MSITSHLSGFYSFLQMVKTYEQADEDIDTNHHESFAQGGANYLIHSPFDLFSKEAPVHQTIVGHSVVVYLSPQKTIIDEALQSYPPERFDNDVVEIVN
jgi:hypothetical protein